MKNKLLLLLLFIGGYAFQQKVYQIKENRIISHIVDPQQQDLAFFWQDKAGRNFKNFENLQQHLAAKNKRLIFAINGGMFQKDLSPQGLYIEKSEVLCEIERRKKGYGNFYLQPNGIFYLTKNKKAEVCATSDFKQTSTIEYATQSGPLLLYKGHIHPKLTKGSKNLHIRNGVGILPDGKILFAMSKEKINFYDFATFFKQNGCQDALYLDGFVSKMYLPSKNWEQQGGHFGVIIAETSD